MSVMPRNMHTYTQSKTLALYGPNLSDEKMATFGVGASLNNPCCYGYQSSDGNIFLNLFAIKHYLRQFYAKFGASIAKSRCMSVQRTFGHIEIRPNSTAFWYV